MAHDQEPFMINPTKLCCGKKMSEHGGSERNICPDMRVMCCLCFSRFPLDKLTTLPEGGKVDVCQGCTQDEAAYENYLRDEGTWRERPKKT